MGWGRSYVKLWNCDETWFQLDQTDRGWLYLRQRGTPTNRNRAPGTPSQSLRTSAVQGRTSLPSSSILRAIQEWYPTTPRGHPTPFFMDGQSLGTWGAFGLSLLSPFPIQFSLTLIENVMGSRKVGRMIRKDLGKEDSGVKRIRRALTLWYVNMWRQMLLM